MQVSRTASGILMIAAFKESRGDLKWQDVENRVSTICSASNDLLTEKLSSILAA